MNPRPITDRAISFLLGCLALPLFAAFLGYVAAVSVWRAIRGRPQPYDIAED